MQRLVLSSTALALLFTVAACNDSNNFNDNNDDNDVMQPLGNSIQAIANQGPDDPALEVTDVAALQSSLADQFGGPDDPSDEFNDDDTLQDIVN